MEGASVSDGSGKILGHHLEASWCGCELAMSRPFEECLPNNAVRSRRAMLDNSQARNCHYTGRRWDVQDHFAAEAVSVELPMLRQTSSRHEEVLKILDRVEKLSGKKRCLQSTMEKSVESIEHARNTAWKFQEMVERREHKTPDLVDEDSDGMTAPSAEYRGKFEGFSLRHWRLFFAFLAALILAVVGTQPQTCRPEKTEEREADMAGGQHLTVSL